MDFRRSPCPVFHGKEILYLVQKNKKKKLLQNRIEELETQKNLFLLLLLLSPGIACWIYKVLQFLNFKTARNHYRQQFLKRNKRQ